MMENIVLLVHCFLMFQNITGSKSLAVKDNNDGERVHLVKEVLTVVYLVITCWLPSWFGAAVLWSGKCVLRILKDSGRRVFFQGHSP